MYLRKPVKERFLNMGKKRRWFDRPSLHSKIEEVEREVKSQGSSKTVFMKVKEKEVTDVDESNTSFDIVNSDSDNADDEDELNYGGDAEDPIGNFSELNPDGFNIINHETKLDISEQKVNSLSSKTDLFNGKIVENSDGSEISEFARVEKFSSPNKSGYSNDDNGHTGSDDDDDTTDNESDAAAYKDLQSRSVEGETHPVKSDSESDSSVELTRPRFRRACKNNFIEVITISDSPMQSSEFSCVAKSSSPGGNVIEDISISADCPVKTGEVSSVENSCSHSSSEEYSDNLNDNKGDDDVSINDKCLDDSYVIKQEQDRLTPLLVNSYEVGGNDESNLSTESISPKSSRNDHSNSNFEDIISSPVNPNEMSSVEESCSYGNEEEYYDNNEHTDVDNDQESCDDDDNEDMLFSDTEQEPDYSTPHEVDGNDESNSSTELINPKSGNDHSINIVKDTNITESPVKTIEASPSMELDSHCNYEEYCGNRDYNNEHDDVDSDYECGDNDDDANEDVMNEDTERDLHHLTSFLVKSNEIDVDSGSDVLADVIHHNRSDHSMADYKCDVIEDVSILDCPVKTHEESTVEEPCFDKNSQRCSDDKDDNDGHNDIDDVYDYGDVIEDIGKESGHLTSLLASSHEVKDDGESKLSTELTSLESSMNIDSSNGIEDNSFSNSPLKPSLSARLFKKYNPEKSDSDVDDFELFLQKIRTPKPSKLSDEGRKIKEASVHEFIVDDDDDDNDYEGQEDDVFFDPGFTPELEEISDDDKENEDIEIATPAASSNLFRTPKSRLLSSNHSSRPKSLLDNILDPYSTEKSFKKSKDKLVQELFELYNRTVFDNQMPSDFQITWNPRMRSTAGFCYYSKKNGLRMARIELADKVIDSADRLRDTLIHELCHAAAWLISGVKAGHGAVWKKWTLRANRVHQDLPPISRCHSYTINAKYTYRCTNNNCANTFGRHSKSVNLEKSRCAYCHSRLELAPQLKKDGTPQTRTPSKFALFVKQNYARIKSDHDRFSHQDVMKALSSEFAKVTTS